MNATVLSVSQLNTYLKSVFEGDPNLNVFIEGEISNFKNHYSSGHLYFSLKDEKSVLKCVMFRRYAEYLKFVPSDGMRVICRGRVAVYERDGQYQLYAEDMQPTGIGALSIAYEQLKNKLEKEGLFDISTKRPLPESPSRVAILTASTGAAIHDMLSIAARRNPLAEIVFAGVQVQGDTAAEQICRAIEKINGLNAADVVIIARGGGSAEDLWPFNDEKLAYAIYNSHIPIISGVGHETDYTICDLAADLRAPTPSAAAELAVPDCREQLYFVSSLKNSIYNSVNSMIDDLNTGLNEILNKPVLLASLDDVVSSEILKDLLSENGIPFSCDTEDEGTLKVTFGGSFSADDIYVDEGDFERANQIYEDFLNSEPEFDEDFFDETEETENADE